MEIVMPIKWYYPMNIKSIDPEIEIEDDIEINIEQVKQMIVNCLVKALS